MEQLKVDTNDLPSIAKKKVAAATALVSSTEAFPTVGLALQVEVPTVAAASIPDWKVGEECWNSGLDGRLEAMAAVAAMSETLPTTSWVLGLYENPVR
jgi:hypothetical protein